MEIINWKIASHPMNWVVLFLMVFIAMLFVSIILNQFGTPAKAEGQTATPGMPG